MTVHVTEAELARDLHAVLAEVEQGIEVIIEQDSRPVAVLKALQVKGRRISEVIAALEASGANALIDEDFARHVEEGINAPVSHGIRAPGSSLQCLTETTAEIIARIV